MNKRSKYNIYIKISGGLGNQLFQYAYALKMKQLFPNKDIIIDYKYYNRKRLRTVELNNLNLIANLIWSNRVTPTFDIAYFIYRCIISLAKRLKMKCKRIKVLESLGYFFTYSSSEYWIPNPELKNIYLAGYFQNEKEIRSVKNQLVETIRPTELLDKSATYLSLIKANEAVGVSIRIGDDYQKLGWPICSMKYYQNGVSLIKQIRKTVKVFIFSDDLNKVKKLNMFDRDDVIYIEGCNTPDSLYLLSQCNHFVIANSTFSWWGAYLGMDAESIVVAPKYYFANTEMRDTGLVLQNAVYLDNEKGI